MACMISGGMGSFRLEENMSYLCCHIKSLGTKHSLFKLDRIEAFIEVSRLQAACLQALMPRALMLWRTGPLLQGWPPYSAGGCLGLMPSTGCISLCSQTDLLYLGLMIMRRLTVEACKISS